MDGTANALRGLQAMRLRASSPETLTSKEIADYVNGQLGKVERAERVWIQPHAWKEGPWLMGPMLQEIANARQRIIEIAEQA